MRIQPIGQYKTNLNNNRNNSNISFGFVGGPGKTWSDNNKISEEFCKEAGKAIKKVGKIIGKLFK